MEYRCHQILNAVWFQTHRANDLKRGWQARLQAPFFPCPRSSAAGSDGSAINPPLVPVQLTLLVKGGTQGDQHGSEAPFLTPATIAVIDCAPGTIAFRNVAPLSAGVQLPKQAIENTPMFGPGMATLRPATRQIGFKQLKLLIS